MDSEKKPTPDQKPEATDKQAQQPEQQSPTQEEIAAAETSRQERIVGIRRQEEVMRVRDQAKIEEIRRGLGLSSETSERAPGARDPKELLLTPEEEGRVKRGEIYRVEAKTGDQEIHVLGVRHTNKVEQTAPMRLEIERYDPEIVIVEGDPLEDIFPGESLDEILAKDETEVLQQKQEQVYIAWLAKKLGKEVRNWDLPAVEQIRRVLELKDEMGLAKHPPDTVVGWISAYALHKVYETGLQPSYESLKQVISIGEPGVEKSGLVDLSEKKIDEMLKKYTGRNLAEFAERFADEKLRAEDWELARRVSDPVPKDEKGEPLPIKQVGETNRVLRDMNHMRDEHAVEVFQRVKQSGVKRVLVTAGGSHAVTWERAIRKIYTE